MISKLQNLSKKPLVDVLNNEEEVANEGFDTNFETELNSSTSTNEVAGIEAAIEETDDLSVSSSHEDTEPDLHEHQEEADVVSAASKDWESMDILSLCQVLKDEVVAFSKLDSFDDIKSVEIATGSQSLCQRLLTTLQTDLDESEVTASTLEYWQDIKSTLDDAINSSLVVQIEEVNVLRLAIEQYTEKLVAPHNQSEVISNAEDNSSESEIDKDANDKVQALKEKIQTIYGILSLGPIADEQRKSKVDKGLEECKDELETLKNSYPGVDLSVVESNIQLCHTKLFPEESDEDIVANTSYRESVSDASYDANVSQEQVEDCISINENRVINHCLNSAKHDLPQTNRNNNLIKQQDPNFDSTSDLHHLISNRDRAKQVQRAVLLSTPFNPCRLRTGFVEKEPDSGRHFAKYLRRTGFIKDYGDLLSFTGTKPKHNAKNAVSMALQFGWDEIAVTGNALYVKEVELQAAKHGIAVLKVDPKISLTPKHTLSEPQPTVEMNAQTSAAEPLSNQLERARTL